MPTYEYRCEANGRLVVNAGTGEPACAAPACGNGFCGPGACGMGD